LKWTSRLALFALAPPSHPLALKVWVALHILKEVLIHFGSRVMPFANFRSLDDG
jgi:hypothetical protein